MTLRSSAFSAVMEALSTTADLAHSTLRWRFSAMDSMKLPVSFSTFFFITSSVFSLAARAEDTGWAAPMRVCGAIAAMSAAIVMNSPALPARAPDGTT